MSNMDFSKMLGIRIECGPQSDKGFYLSNKGLAVKNNEGRIVSFDIKKNEIVDVELLSFEGGSFVYAMPVATSKVKVGDMLFRNDKDEYKVFCVVEVCPNDEFLAVDIKENSKITIMPTKSQFGYNFVTKIFCPIGDLSASASPDNPFGNMMPIMMMQSLQGGNADMNEMLPMMLMMKNGGEDLGEKESMMMMALGCLSNNKEADEDGKNAKGDKGLFGDNNALLMMAMMGALGGDDANGLMGGNGNLNPLMMMALCNGKGMDSNAMMGLAMAGMLGGGNEAPQTPVKTAASNPTSVNPTPSNDVQAAPTGYPENYQI